MKIVTEVDLASQQNTDGSFGNQLKPEDRIVTTIFAVRSLQEAGLFNHNSIPPSLNFLIRYSIVDGAGSIQNSRDSVLSCYNGMVARLLIDAGYFSQAKSLLDWIIKYQPIAYGGTTYLQSSQPIWGDYLRSRFGGCMSNTTCVLGLVPSMSALVAAKKVGIDVNSENHLKAMRNLLVDREVIFARSGKIIPLSGRTKTDPHGIGWLLPAFPLNYVVDLIELVQLAQQLKVPYKNMNKAIDLIKSWQLPDGSWPMLGKRRLPIAYRPELVARDRPSEIITRRVKDLNLNFG